LAYNKSPTSRNQLFAHSHSTAHLRLQARNPTNNERRERRDEFQKRGHRNKSRERARYDATRNPAQEFALTLKHRVQMDAMQYDHPNDLPTWVMGLMAVVEVEEIDPPSRTGSGDKADPSARVELSDEASICSDTDTWNEPAFYYDEIEWKHEEEASSYGVDIFDEAETIVSTGDETDFKDHVATDIIAKAVYEESDSDTVNCG